MYADDVAIAIQATTFQDLEEILNTDLKTPYQYFQEWYLQVNPRKTVSSTFHLSNIQSNRQLQLNIEGTNTT